MKTAIVGGGASGMACAVECARRGNMVTVFERQSRLGKKLSCTGGGRCNIMNASLDPSRYNNPDFVRGLFARIDAAELEAFFRSVGIFLSVPDNEGRVYPVTEHASTVVDCLRRACLSTGVSTCFLEVEKITEKDGIFELLCSNGETNRFDKVILACGSGSQAAKPFLDGFINRQYLTPVEPSLTPLKVVDPLKGVGGIRARAIAKLFAVDELLGEEKGEIQFRDFGLSGIAIFNLSAIIARDKVKRICRDYRLEVDFVPFLSADGLTSELENRLSRGATKETLFYGLLQNKLAEQLVRRCHDASARGLTLSVKRHDFSGATTLGFDMSQVTSGGVDTRFLDERFALPNGMVVVGEAIDIDGICGGHNLAFAFASALAAARSN